MHRDAPAVQPPLRCRTCTASAACCTRCWQRGELQTAPGHCLHMRHCIPHMTSQYAPRLAPDALLVDRLQHPGIHVSMSRVRCTARHHTASPGPSLTHAACAGTLLRPTPGGPGPGATWWPSPTPSAPRACGRPCTPCPTPAARPRCGSWCGSAGRRTPGGGRRRRRRQRSWRCSGSRWGWGGGV